MAEGPYYHKSLRNRNINYRSGWWSVSIQVAKNKSIFGAMPNHYWDDLITSEAEFKGWQKYIRENPANWSSDRYGACTAHVLGDVELLYRPRIAFVASQGFYASELRPRKIWAWAGAGTGTRTAKPAPSDKVGEGDGADKVGEGDGGDNERGGGLGKVLISTFTSAQEREALRRALAKKRPLVAVFPAGIPKESEMVAGLAVAIREGWALAVSPQAPGSRLNKKIATWCNEFLIKNAEEIWVGDLSPNGMLTQMLKGLGRLSMVDGDVSKRAASAAQEEA